jgi:hypothetical protein
MYISLPHKMKKDFAGLTKARDNLSSQFICTTCFNPELVPLWVLLCFFINKKALLESDAFLFLLKIHPLNRSHQSLLPIIQLLFI